MDILTAVIYGVIQGLSEFLPVSSSGHLALLPFFMELKDPGVVFDLCMHMGTALAVVIYFRVWIMRLLTQFVPAITNLKTQQAEHHFIRNFILSTFVSVLIIFCLRPLADYGRNPWFIAFNQAFFGILLWVADVQQRKNALPNRTDGFFSQGWKFFDAALIGMAQAIAIFPGVSRSGVTMSAAFIRGIDRKEAGAFSFLLSLPVIFGGVILEVPAIKDALATGEQSWAILSTGVITSFIVGFLTIHFFMKLISRIHLGWFTGYRLFLALLLVVMLLN
jgi:undecaprenyl-diphosphatase